LDARVRADSYDAKVPVDRKQIKVTSFDYLVFEDGKGKWTHLNEIGFTGVILTGKTKSPISLNGEYAVRVGISADELLSLLVAATKNWPESFLLNWIEAARKAATNG
jgi:hypothetical protein